MHYFYQSFLLLSKKLCFYNLYLDREEIVIWEYWTEKESFVFQTKAKGYSHLDLQYYPFYSDFPEIEDGYYLPHNYGEVPFIPFYNNIEKNDLNDMKPLIDRKSVV